MGESATKTHLSKLCDAHFVKQKPIIAIGWNHFTKCYNYCLAK